MTIPNEQPKLNSLNYLRVLAMVMILYDHLGAFRNSEWTVKKGMDLVFTTPLHIIQDFGALGVSLFFILSGFLFPWNAHYEKVIPKTLTRIIKFYLSSLIAFIIFWLFNAVCWNFLDYETYWKQFSWRQWLESITLLGYFTGNGEVINGATWFLIPLFFFYAITVFYSLFIKKHPGKAMWFIETGLCLLWGFLNIWGQEYLTRLLIFVYIPITGMILSEIYRADHFSFVNGICLFIVNYVLMVLCFYKFHSGYYAENPYIISFVYAIFLVVMFFSLEKHFAENKYIHFCCNISLPVYLLQMTWGQFIMSVFDAWKLRFTVTFILTVLSLVGIAWFHSKYIDNRLINHLYHSIRIGIQKPWGRNNQ